MMKAYLCLKIMRPHQWLKNLMLLFPPFLGGAMLNPGMFARGVTPFIAFSLASSAAYVANDLPVIDVFCVALVFVLRLYVGGEAFGVFITDWLFMTVFLLALFLSIGKRYSERLQLGGVAGAHRRALGEYPDGSLENAVSISGSAVLVTYSLYVINRPYLVYTVPLCMFGLMRYLFCVKSGQSGDPTHALLRDGPLLTTGILWVAMVAWGLYQ